MGGPQLRTPVARMSRRAGWEARTHVPQQPPSPNTPPQVTEQQALQLRDAQQHLQLVEGELEGKTKECTDLLSESLALKARAAVWGRGGVSLVAGQGGPPVIYSTSGSSPLTAMPPGRAAVGSGPTQPPTHPLTPHHPAHLPTRPHTHKLPSVFLSVFCRGACKSCRTALPPPGTPMPRNWLPSRCGGQHCSFPCGCPPPPHRLAACLQP